MVSRAKLLPVCHPCAERAGFGARDDPDEPMARTVGNWIRQFTQTSRAPGSILRCAPPQPCTTRGYGSPRNPLFLLGCVRAACGRIVQPIYLSVDDETQAFLAQLGVKPLWIGHLPVLGPLSVCVVARERVEQVGEPNRGLDELVGARCLVRPHVPAVAYCVLTATLVAPRVTPAASLKRTKIRLLAGSKGIGPPAVTNRPKVGVSPALNCVVTLGPIAELQAPVAGLVWQSEMVTGIAVCPVSAEAAIIPPAPTLTVATAKTPASAALAERATTGFGTFTMPSLLSVAASATMSGTGVIDPESSSVLTPEIDDELEVLAHPIWS